MGTQEPDVVVAAVYRRRCADRLATLLDSLAPLRADVRLWALDEPAPALAGRTVGQGAGGKFELVNAALAARDVPAGVPVVVTDDDVTLGRGSLAALVERGREAGFGLWQAAHARGSQGAHPVTFRRPWSRARRTTFVEIGPVFVVDGPGRERVLPFPAGIGMGWGLEIDWWRLGRDGLALGVVDEVTVMHDEAPGVTYGQDAEWARLSARLRDAGLGHVREAQQTLGTWRPWQRRAPWLGSR